MEITATAQKMPNPLTIRVQAQARRMKAMQDRRDDAAEKGYRGPLTRTELAALAARKYANR